MKNKNKNKGLRDMNKPQPTFHEFPENVENFLQVYPNRYPAGSPPVNSYLDHQELVDMRRPDVMPCRSPATSIRSAVPPMALTNTGMQGIVPHNPANAMLQQQQQLPSPDFMMQMMGGLFNQMRQFMQTGSQASASSPWPLSRVVASHMIGHVQRSVPDSASP